MQHNGWPLRPKDGGQVSPDSTKSRIEDPVQRDCGTANLQHVDNETSSC
jgi:hypothetical protein